MTPASGNTFGAVVWTDGKVELPMMPMPPQVVQCEGCNNAFWLEDAAEVRLIDATDDSPPHGDATQAADRAVPTVREPTPAEYYEAIAAGLGAGGRERRLRTLAMWRENEPYRRNADAPAAPLSPAAAENLEALVPLLDADETDTVLLKAEVLRELGRFEEAKAVLERVTDARYAGVVEAMGRLCDEETRGVRRL
jgi:hypothetical protein